MNVNGGANRTTSRRRRLPPVPPLRRTQWEQAYAELRRRILSLELAPGTPLSEVGVARELGTSPTPVRDALGRLHQQRLLESGPTRGYVVARLSIADVAELAEARFVLESAICQLAIERATPERILAARDIAARLEVPGLDQQALIDRNQDFHLAVAMMARNERLEHALYDVMEDSRRVFHLGLGALRVEDMVEAHRRLLDAIEAKDEVSARLVCEEEAFGTSERVVSQLVRTAATAGRHLEASLGYLTIERAAAPGEGRQK
jgi:DNA-binding GntR family transcriptional regulator